MSDESPPEAPPQITPEQLHAYWTHMIASELPALAGVFAPSVPEAIIKKLASGMATEQLVYQTQMFPTLSDPKLIKESPEFAVRIFRTKGDQIGGAPLEETVRALRAPKQISITHPDSHLNALFTALLLSFVVSPAVRALLRLHGLHYDFVQTKKEPSRIHIPKS